jgi:small subunit ribosomal protein S4
MSKRESAKYKLDRRMGENIWGRPKSPVNRREYGPGQHGQRRKSKLSDFGVQLRAKQKLKGYYGDISEKQFRKIYDEANRMKGDTPENLIGLLESRLDAIVYRAKFVATIFAARQFVNHGHVTVNGVRQHRFVPLQAGRCHRGQGKVQAAGLRLEAVGSWLSATCPNTSKPTTTRWLRPTPACRPCRTCLTPVVMEPNLVVEFYSR